MAEARLMAGPPSMPPAMDEVQARDMERYREAYRRRCES